MTSDKTPRRARRLVLALVTAGLLPVLLAGAGFIILLGENVGSLPSTVPVSGHDGLWLGHAWVGGRRTPGDLDVLTARLRQTGIREVFVHVGPLSDDGPWTPRCAPAPAGCSPRCITGCPACGYKRGWETSSARSRS